MEKYILLAIFGIAMAHFEGVVVVYLRKAIGILVSGKDITNASGGNEFWVCS